MKGILLQPWGIQATVEGRKTVTRRCDQLKEINKEPDEWILKEPMPVTESGCYWFQHPQGGIGEYLYNNYPKPRYLPGETVYIKEAWAVHEYYDGRKPRDIPEGVTIECKLMPDLIKTEGNGHRKIREGERGKWRSPLFMPAWAARHLIKIKDNGAEFLKMPLSPEELEREGGEPALVMLGEIDGKWVFRYEYEYLGGKL